MKIALSPLQKLRAAGKFLDVTFNKRPISVSIEVTKRCNARCDFCDYWKISDRDEMTDFTDVVRRFDPLVVVFTGGEPMLRRDLVPPDVAPHVVGYDPDVFTVMGYCMPTHSRHDDRRFRSHLSLIVSRMVNKMITLPVLKDHRSAGVTLALKNMSHGMNNNVARSHLSGIAHGFGRAERVTGPNQCNTFIPQAVAQLRLRQKATLHILDGLIGVYEGGPGCWNRTWSTWRHKGLFFATDPVALDHVGWDLIDRKRAEMGWPAVGAMGLVSHPPHVAEAPGHGAQKA